VSLADRLLHPIDLEKAEAAVAGELMTERPATIAPEASLADAARLLLAEQVKRLPVVDADGRLVGIVSRSDLLRVFLRPDAEIRYEVREVVVARELSMDPFRFQITVCDGVVALVGQVERRSQIPLLSDLVRSVEGVVRVIDRDLTYAVDDTTSRLDSIPRMRL
jgi:CBS-domain-containing membrane protein